MIETMTKIAINFESQEDEEALHNTNQDHILQAVIHDNK